MKKKYTKRQITEAIAYWKNQLKMINESLTDVGVESIQFSADGSGSGDAAINKPGAIVICGIKDSENGPYGPCKFIANPIIANFFRALLKDGGKDDNVVIKVNDYTFDNGALHLIYGTSYDQLEQITDNCVGND